MTDRGIRGPTMEKKIGGTTYKVTSVYSKKATETAVQKMERLILKDAEKVMKKCKYPLKTAEFCGIIYT